MTLLLNQQNSLQSEEDERWRVREEERGGDGGEREGGERKDEQKDEKGMMLMWKTREKDEREGKIGTKDVGKIKK